MERYVEREMKTDGEICKDRDEERDGDRWRDM